MASPPNHPLRAEGGGTLRWSQAAWALLVGFLTVAALSIARDIFVPLALAILLSFALGPLVQVLRRYHCGRIPSIFAAVLLAFLVIFGVGAVIGSQLADLAGNLPAYRSNVIDKIHALQQSVTSNGLFARGAAILSDLGKEVAATPPPAGKPPNGPPAAQHAAQPQKPMPVEIHQPEPTPYQIVESIVGPLLQPLATTGIVVVFVIFFLAQREDLRDRFIRLAGARDIQRTTHALDDAGERLSGYLLAQSGINACFGVLVGIGLWIIGVPNPLLWGTLALLLR
ncbi:MAG TPA: AI-2E family transporter, partial [Candidatus Sulfotelmatobacter sp.]|nr:AI-2E family transporter [Candidatus Sulfotelmatobacter sp.]